MNSVHAFCLEFLGPEQSWELQCSHHLGSTMNEPSVQLFPLLAV